MPIISHKYKNEQTNSVVTETNLSKLVDDIATLNVLLTCPLAFRHSSPFRYGSVTIKIGPRKTQILCLKIGCNGNVP